MRFLNCLSSLLVAGSAVQTVALSIPGKPALKVKPYKRDEPLQDIVTWDQHSIFVHGERVLFYSGGMSGSCIKLLAICFELQWQSSAIFILTPGQNTTHSDFLCLGSGWMYSKRSVPLVIPGCQSTLTGHWYAAGTSMLHCLSNSV